jgi:inner membrane protein
MSSQFWLDPWLFSVLLAFCLVTTLGASWLVGKIWRRKQGMPMPVSSAVAELIWILLLFAASLLAVRYIERADNAILGFLLFGLAAISLSFVRAFLYRRARGDEPEVKSPDGRQLVDSGIHGLTYVLFAIVLFLAISWILHQSADPILFIPLALGALLPDLDTRNSLPGRLMPCVSRWLEDRLGAGGAWHSLTAAALVAALAAPLILVVGVELWVFVPLGYVSHLILDLLRPEGEMLFWPVSQQRYNVMGGPLGPAGSVTERWLSLGLVIASAVLLLVADVGPAPAQSAPMPTYEQTLDCYRGLQGRNLVYADVEGAWQATGRRIRARFEVLNAIDDSLIMLEPFTGRVFRAGRSAKDQLYLNQVSVWPGDPARVKAVELQLANQPLAEVLPILYEMQSEPGLQHIFVSGELILASSGSVGGSGLREDLTDTRLPKVAFQGEGRYLLRYLTASELIELAKLQVDAGNVVIVATYSTSPADPTPTPLPQPPELP